MKSINTPTALRSLIKFEPIVRCLGAHDVLSSMIIAQAGLECIFIGGFGCSASLLGLPDMNLLTLTNMVDCVRRIAQAVNVPIIADGDTGHGDLHNVQRTIQLFERAGAAGVLLEDQVTPKRCGHFAGKQVIPTREMVLKIHAALDIREDKDLVLIARTDALAVTGLEDAIDRACRYAEAGADICYIEAPRSIDEIALIPKRVPKPVLINMLTGGQTPSLSVEELRQMGYKMVLWPIESTLVAAKAVRDLAQKVVTTDQLEHDPPTMLSFSEIQDLVGLPKIMQLREKIEGRVT